MQRIGDVWAQLFPAEQQRITRLLIERVQLHGHGLDIVWREDGWIGFGADIGAHPLVEESSEQAKEATNLRKRLHPAKTKPATPPTS